MAVNLSRRWFLGGALAVAGATALPSLSKVYPLIIGDGVHDDTLGFQAALDGKTFMIGDQVMAGAKDLILRGGQYRITDTLRISKSCGLIGEDNSRRSATIISEHDGPFIRLDKDVENVRLEHLILRSKDAPAWPGLAVGTPLG